MLNLYGMKIGIKLLLRGQTTPALKKLIRPVSYWRAISYKLVLEEAGFHGGDRVLDIGSPKLLALYLAKHVGAEVYATDLDDYFVGEYILARRLEGIAPQKLTIKTEDGRKLSFPDNYFTKVFSISTVEHIPEHGDTECMKEIARVLCPGGLCLITTPFWPTSKNEYRDRRQVYWAKHLAQRADGKVFYQRRYSEQDLYERLITPSGLRLRKLEYVGDKVMVNSERELVDMLPIVTGPIEFLLSKMWHTRPSASWRALKKPLSAFIVLEK